MMGRFTPERIVATATACGMEAIDWVSTHHTEPAELRKISEDAGLRIAAHTMIKEKFLLVISNACCFCQQNQYFHKKLRRKNCSGMQFFFVKMFN